MYGAIRGVSRDSSTECSYGRARASQLTKTSCWHVGRIISRLTLPLSAGHMRSRQTRDSAAAARQAKAPPCASPERLPASPLAAAGGGAAPSSVKPSGCASSSHSSCSHKHCGTQVFYGFVGFQRFQRCASLSHSSCSPHTSSVTLRLVRGL